MSEIYDFDIAAILFSLTLLISFFIKKMINTRVTKSFSFLLAFVIFSSIFDFITRILIMLNKPSLLIYVYIAQTLYFIFIIVVPASFTNCIYAYVSVNKMMDLKDAFILNIPLIISSVLVILSPFTGWVFKFSSDFTLIHGSVFPLVYIVSSYYFFLSACYIGSYFYQFTKEQILTLILYVMIIFFAIIVQTKLNHRVQIVVFISSFSFFFIYNSLENPTSFVEDESGLFNRKGFVEIVRNHLRKQKSFRIVGVKLVGLKYLNQTIGYDNRMNLMIYISNEIRNICGYKNIFRISRTRFAIILPDDVNVQYEVIERIRNLFKESVSVPGSDTEIAVSVYITYLTCPADADNVEDVVDLIETSLSNFNDSDVGKVEKVNRYILAKRRRENQILQILKNAIRKSEFDVYFQPIFSLKKNRFTTAEALIRLKNEELGYIGPDEFIPVAEKNGIILPIGEYVFEQVCRFLVKEKLWEKGIEYIHVNLSVVQCMQDKLYRQIISIMDAYNLDYSFINFEVTETAAIVSKETLLQNMNELMKRKIFFSLDDYGTGFSNTSSLVNYPFCAIKLDKTLIWAAMEEEKAMSILEHTIKMVKSLGMKVVAEGVETEEQVRILENLDCDYIQGYLFSKPISSKNFVELLNKKRGISETDEED